VLTDKESVMCETNEQCSSAHSRWETVQRGPRSLISLLGIWMHGAHAAALAPGTVLEQRVAEAVSSHHPVILSASSHINEVVTLYLQCLAWDNPVTLTVTLTVTLAVATALAPTYQHLP